MTRERKVERKSIRLLVRRPSDKHECSRQKHFPFHYWQCLNNPPCIMYDSEIPDWLQALYIYKIIIYNIASGEPHTCIYNPNGWTMD